MAQDIHEPMIQDREAKLEKILFQADVLRAEIKVLREAQSVAKGVKSERPASKTRQRQLKQGKRGVSLSGGPLWRRGCWIARGFGDVSYWRLDPHRGVAPR